MYGMKKKRVMIIGIIALAVILITAAYFLVLKKPAEKILNIGVRKGVSDWVAYDESRDFCIGIEESLGELIAAKTGYTGVHCVPIEIKDARKALLDGEVDCLMYAYPSEDPEGELSYSEPYYQSNTALLAKQSTLFETIEDIAGKPVGTLSYFNFPSESLLKRMKEAGLEAPVLCPDDNINNLLDKLETGELSALCLPYELAYTYFENNCMSPGSELGMADAAIAFRKDDPEGTRFSEAIRELIADGTIQLLLSLWGW